jgi:hypothetical protein
MMPAPKPATRPTHQIIAAAMRIRIKRREAAMPLEDPGMSVDIRRTSGMSRLKLTRSSSMINQLNSAPMQAATNSAVHVQKTTNAICGIFRSSHAVMGETMLRSPSAVTPLLQTIRPLGEEWPKLLIFVVGSTGIEPVTPTMSRQKNNREIRI